MAKLERIRESVEGSLDPEYLKQREKAGWRLVGVEWEREADERLGESEDRPGSRVEDPPYGVRVGGDCEHLEENPDEMQFLLSMMELIIQDGPYSSIAEELNRRGYRTREGSKWTPVSVFEMLPRLIDAGPRILSSENWYRRKQEYNRRINPPVV